MNLCPACGGLETEHESENDFSQSEAITLAAAIARGDCAAAAEALDLMVRDSLHAVELREWFARGRASVLASPSMHAHEAAASPTA